MKDIPVDAAGFYKGLEKENACDEAKAWAQGKDLRTIWDTCERGDWLEWLLKHAGYEWEAPARAEYLRVTARAIRAIVPYPFADETGSLLAPAGKEIVQ